MKKRKNIDLMVFLTIITLGLYWVYCSSLINKKLAMYDGEKHSHFCFWILSIMSLFFYTAYRNQKSYDKLETKTGVSINQDYTCYKPRRSSYTIPFILQQQINHIPDEKLAEMKRKNKST